MAAYEYITNTGVIVADTSDIKQEVEAEYKAALGQSLNTDASTPQGTLIAAETLSRTGVMKNNAELANQINPNLAEGVFLDAISALTGTDRGVDRSTIVQDVLMRGNSTTVITAGSRIQIGTGDIFELAAPITIPVSGEISTAVFRSEVSGDIPVPVGPAQIIDGIIGWGSVEILPTSTVIPGALALTDPALRNFRNLTLFRQGIGSSGAIQAAALNVENVTSVRVVENNTSTVTTVNGVPFTLPNAMWVCVAGTPDQAELAMALYKAHQGGCPWDWGTAAGVPVGPVEVADPWTGLPYLVKWTTPILYDVYYHLDVEQVNTTSDPVAAVRKAILDYATGQMSGEQGLIIGESISAFEAAGAVAREIPGLYIKDCKVCVLPAGSPAPVYPSGYVYEHPLAMFEQGQTNSGNIIVNIIT